MAKEFQLYHMPREQQEEYILNAIMESFVLMDASDWANWSPETAQLLIDDFRRYDDKMGIAPIDYDAQEVYDTMLALRESNEEENDG